MGDKKKLNVPMDAVVDTSRFEHNIPAIVRNPRETAEREIAKLVAASPKLRPADASGPVQEGPDGIFFQDFGPRAVYHHGTHGTYVLYGEILNAYRFLGDSRFTLGAPLGTEENAPPVRDEELGRTLSPRQVRFVEGAMFWTPERGIHIWRPENSRCTVSWDVRVIQQRSRDDFHDNLWLSTVWLVGGQTISKTVPLRGPGGSTEIHGEADKTEGHTPIQRVEDYVVCNRHDPVTVFYRVTNFNGGTFDDQLRWASKITQDVVDTVAPYYVSATGVVLGVVATGGLGAVPLVIGLVAGGTSALATGYPKKIADITHSVTSQVNRRVTNFLSDTLIDLGLNRANCSGPVLDDYVVFDTAEPRDVALNSTYRGLSVPHGCQSPVTEVTLRMQRTVNL